MTTEPADRHAIATNKHTPGPWTVEGFTGDEHRRAELTIESPYGQIASVVSENCDIDAQIMADAALMAAAPDLLRAAVGVCNSHLFQGSHDCRMEPLIEKLRQAIHKAITTS